MTYGAKIIAQALHDLGVKVIFGLPGLPVTDIGQEGLYLGIRFISFRNEQAAVYAASAYGYLTGRPGVMICVGGPGIIHAFAGVCCLLQSRNEIDQETDIRCRSHMLLRTHGLCWYSLALPKRTMQAEELSKKWTQYL